MEKDDQETFRRIKAGEIDQFAQIVKKYESKIERFVKQRLFDKEEADDLIQNTFISFYKALGRLDHERPVLPYLYQIAKNELKMYFRRKNPEVSLNQDLVADNKDFFDGENEVDKILETLPREQKEILQLVTEGYSYQEIAKQLGRPLNTVKTLIRRARLKLVKLPT